jgi:hypothetical protein
MPPEPSPIPRIVVEWAKRVNEQVMEQWERTYRFAQPWGSSERDEIDRVYRDEVKEPANGMGCMAACYRGLEVLYADRPKYANDPDRESLQKKVWDIADSTGKFNNVDLMMETLRTEGRAGEPLTVTWDRKAKAWNPPPEEELMKMIDPAQKGVYFFGLSVAKGNHTVLLAVDNTADPPQVFWLDQHTRGLVKDVTGELGKKLGAHWRDPSLPNRIWPLRPVQMSTATP